LLVGWSLANVARPPGLLGEKLFKVASGCHGLFEKVIGGLVTESVSSRVRELLRLVRGRLRYIRNGICFCHGPNFLFYWLFGGKQARERIFSESFGIFEFLLHKRSHYSRSRDVDAQ
jgi:hypothetical protein